MRYLIFLLLILSSPNLYGESSTKYFVKMVGSISAVKKTVEKIKRKFPRAQYYAEKISITSKAISDQKIDLDIRLKNSRKINIETDVKNERYYINFIISL